MEPQPASRRRKDMRPVRLLVLALVVAACGTAGDPAVDQSSTSASEPGDTTTVSTTTTLAVELPEGLSAELVDSMMADAADRSGLSTDPVRVNSIEPVDFNDTSLGCPEPGKMYAQVITPGFVVIVEAGGEEFDYRAAEGADTYRLCE